MINLLLIDKDQTLVETTNPNGFVNKPNEQVIKPGADSMLFEYYSRGYLIYVVSNQGGVAKGFKSLQNAHDEMKYCNQLFSHMGKDVFKAFLYCPNQWQSRGDECWVWEPGCFVETKYSNDAFSMYGYRKPNPGMLLLAYEFACKKGMIQSVTMIGDRDTDREAAANASRVLGREIVYKDIKDAL